MSRSNRNEINSSERAGIFPFLLLSAKQEYYWYHFYNVFGMTRSLIGGGLNPGPPALKASTLPLGYRGGGTITYNMQVKWRPW